MNLLRFSLGLVLLSSAAWAGGAVGQFSQHGDSGAPAIAGSTSYDSTLQQYLMSAGGINLWGSSDQFHFAWNTLKGDFIVRARAEFIGEGVDPHRKYGWMARAGTDADAA